MSAASRRILANVERKQKNIDASAAIKDGILTQNNEQGKSTGEAKSVDKSAGSRNLR